jgi:UDP-N-acetylglucosamine 2-epimerase
MLGNTARFLHTSQHTDTELSGVFLAAAGLPRPETLDGICGQPRHAQVGRIDSQSARGVGVGELGRRLISDPGLRERLEAIPCPFGDGRASERITRVLKNFLR